MELTFSFHSLLWSHFWYPVSVSFYNSNVCRSNRKWIFKSTHFFPSFLSSRERRKKRWKIVTISLDFPAKWNGWDCLQMMARRMFVNINIFVVWNVLIEIGFFWKNWQCVSRETELKRYGMKQSIFRSILMIVFAICWKCIDFFSG